MSDSQRKVEVAQCKLHHAQKRGRLTFRTSGDCESYLRNVEHDIVLTNHRHMASSGVGVVAKGVERSPRSCSEQLRRGQRRSEPGINYLICYLASLGPPTTRLSLLARLTSHKLSSPPARKERVSVPRFLFFIRSILFCFTPHGHPALRLDSDEALPLP